MWKQEQRFLLSAIKNFPEHCFLIKSTVIWKQFRNEQHYFVIFCKFRYGFGGVVYFFCKWSPYQQSKFSIPRKNKPDNSQQDDRWFINNLVFLIRKNNAFQRIKNHRSNDHCCNYLINTMGFKICFYRNPFLINYWKMIPNPSLYSLPKFLQ